MAPPPQTKAVVITKPGQAEVLTVPTPKLPDDYILVRTTAVALNPTDWKHIDAGRDLGSRVGCDYAGIVEEVGSKVTKPFKKGDRICGMVHGSNKLQPEGGAFAEYIIVKGDIQIKIPDNFSDEEAATLGVGISTVGQGLYQGLGLPLPETSPSASAPSSAGKVLIYGGSTATGLLAIQYAKLSGYRVATTCSTSNFDYVKSLGADAAFDYRSPTVVEDIKAWSREGETGVDQDDSSLTLALDCIAEPATARLCAAALSRRHGGQYRSLLAIEDDVVKAVNPKVDVGYKFAYTATGEPADKFFANLPASAEDFEFAKKFWNLSRELLVQGKLKPARTDGNRGGKGLEGVLVGLRDLKEGRVSGTKLVYTL
ncbi:hypothetical protein VTK56DRAFT_979 [Thermocarpiscus australiensis]